MTRRTPDQIRLEGLDALRIQLGRADMLRFLQQFDAGRGDYARQRRRWAQGLSLAGIKKLSKKRAKKAG
jgi:hypothetical protein